MKRLLLLVLGLIVFGLATATAVRADCDTPDPGDPTSFE